MPDCTRKVLAGHLRNQLSLSDQVLFWEGVFGLDFKVDDREVELRGECQIE